MNCPKCNRTFFKPFDDGSMCINCATLILDEIIPQEISPRMLVKWQHETHTSDVRTRKCVDYMATVYDQIQDAIKELKSWNQINLMLGARPACACVRSLKKYYRRQQNAAL